MRGAQSTGTTSPFTQQDIEANCKYSNITGTYQQTRQNETNEKRFEIKKTVEV